MMACHTLPLWMPADPGEAGVIRRWAAERGLELIELGVRGEFPRHCKMGRHIQLSAADIGHEGRCRWCRRADYRRAKRRSAGG